MSNSWLSKRFLSATIPLLKATLRRSSASFRPNHSIPHIMRDKHGFRYIAYPWNKVSGHGKAARTCNDDDFAPIDRLIEPGALVIDIGANIGAYSYHFSVLSGSTGLVHALEPVGFTYRHLCENIVLNHCSTVVTHRLAIGEYTGACEMFTYGERLSGWNGRGGSVMSGHTPKTREIVQIQSLDDFCNEQSIQVIDFLKIDVEGFEDSVLHGAKSLLSRGAIRIIMFEVSQAPLEGSGKTALPIFQILEKYGYLSYRFDRRRDVFVGPVHDSQAYFANYFATIGRL